jgi:hypothetical protein
MKSAITRYLNRDVRAFQVPGSVDKPLELEPTYQIERDGEVLSHTTALDLGRQPTRPITA